MENNENSELPKKTFFSFFTFDKKRYVATGIGFFMTVAFFARFGYDITHFTAARKDADSDTQIVSPLNPSQETTDLLVLEGEYHKGKKDKDQADKLISKAKSRRDAMKNMIIENPEKALQVAFTEEAKKNLPPEAQPYIESETSLEGTLDSIMTDDFKNKKSKLLHRLRVGDKSYSLHLTDDESVVKSGIKAKVRGIQVDDEVAVDNRQGKNVEIQSDSKTLGVTTPVTKKVAVILVSFQNTPSLPFTPDQARTTIFTGSQSVKAFYKEASFGSWDLQGNARPDGDVFGWITVPYSNANCSSMFSTWSTNADNQLRAQGIDVNIYNNLIYILNDAPNCPGAGWASVGGSYSWISYGLDLQTIVHELGHNYGANHASSKICKDSTGRSVSISKNCTNDEYGDPYDVMGSSIFPFSSFNKGVFHWYEGSNTQTVTTSGKYTIAPLGPNTSGVQALRIAYPQIPGMYYYLELRRPYGVFENFLTSSEVANGVTIRLASDYYMGNYSYILDTNPTTGTFVDAPLQTGRAFIDSDSGISIITQSISFSGALVDVSISTATCVRSRPQVAIYPLSVFANAGETRTYQLSLTNKDSTSCPASNFSVSASYPSGWTLSPAAITQTLTPGSTYNGMISLTSSSNALPSVYLFTETATHGSDPTLTFTTSANYNVNTPPAPPTSTPAPTQIPTTVPNLTIAPSTSNPPTSVPTTRPVSASPTPGVVSDTTPPTVAFTYPVHNGQISRKSTVTMTANASDNKGVTKVEFYVNGSLQCTDLSATYSCAFDTENKPNVGYKLQAKAYDAAGNNSTATIQVTSK